MAIETERRRKGGKGKMVTRTFYFSVYSFAVRFFLLSLFLFGLKGDSLGAQDGRDLKKKKERHERERRNEEKKKKGSDLFPHAHAHASFF